MKTDRQIIDQLHRALDSLHLACETSPPDIYEWYSAGIFGPEAREKALEALKAARDRIDAEQQGNRANETIEWYSKGMLHGLARKSPIAEARREGYESGFEDGGGSSPHETIAALEADAAAALKAAAAAESEARQEAWAAGYHYANKFNTPKKP
jgi:flagellar biosynthesis/type III secretory pathway protein FliH